MSVPLKGETFMKKKNQIIIDFEVRTAELLPF